MPRAPSRPRVRCSRRRARTRRARLHASQSPALSRLPPVNHEGGTPIPAYTRRYHTARKQGSRGLRSTWSVYPTATVRRIRHNDATGTFSNPKCFSALCGTVLLAHDSGRETHDMTIMIYHKKRKTPIWAVGCGLSVCSAGFSFWFLGAADVYVWFQFSVPLSGFFENAQVEQQQS